MAEQFGRVRPGDLITASDMNRILEKLNSLESRVSTLEAVGPSGTSIVITGLLPSGPVSMQSELRVVGRNFGLPGTNVVTIDDVQVTQFKPGSSDTQLIFDIPLIQGVPPEGKVVTLTVSNPRGFASTSFILLPAVPTVPTGNLFVNLTHSPLDPQLLAGQSYTFVFTVKAITNLDEVYTLTPSVQASWPAIIVDPNNIAISPQEIRLPKGDPPNGSTQDVRVRVTIPAGTAVNTSTQVRLTVTSKRNPSGLTKSSGGDTITVGSAPPPPQQIVVSFNNVLSPAPPTPSATVQNGVVVIPAVNTTYRVDFTALIRDPGTYNVALTSPGTNWVAAIQGATLFDTTTSNENRLIMTSVSAQAGAAATNLILRVTKANDATVFGQFQQPIRLGP